ncbi:hypothetical protein GOBAR_AA19033 [Gossypium barbadense]|uniref:Uncharacterized protein n=1 Tax=Gossypium barbadense TaxID=3634 RepID=A0A2P5XE66_GOSBA|nr:hypothetical protein GOBAR_AA19033 [Gossypium barbadense]
MENTETTFKNQQASIQGLETQIGQLAKLISKLDKVACQAILNLAQGSNSTQLPFKMRKEYKPRVPYPNVTRKDRLDEQFGKFLKLLKKLHINLPFIEALSQMPNVEISLKDTHEPCLIHNKGSTHEERMLQIEELDEWLTFKPRKHDEPKLRQNELNTSPNQLKVGDKVSLDAAVPYIDTAKPNEEIPLTVLSIFSFGTVEVSHPKFDTFKVYHTDMAKHMGVLRTVWKQGKRFSPAWATINRHGRAKWPVHGLGEIARRAEIQKNAKHMG